MTSEFSEDQADHNDLEDQRYLKKEMKIWTSFFSFSAKLATPTVLSLSFTATLTSELSEDQADHSDQK